MLYILYYYQRSQFQIQSVLNGPLILVCKLMQTSQSCWMFGVIAYEFSANEAERTQSSLTQLSIMPPHRIYQSQGLTARAKWIELVPYALYGSCCPSTSQAAATCVASRNVAMDTKGVKRDLR